MGVGDWEGRVYLPTYEQADQAHVTKSLVVAERWAEVCWREGVFLFVCLGFRRLSAEKLHL